VEQVFKYISNILSTITPGQRLVALCVLLLSIVVITIVPNIIDATTKDNEELNNKINIQRKEIQDLYTRVKDLNTQLINNESEGTNKLINKEKQILQVINELERDLTFSKKQINVANYRMINDSTTNMSITTQTHPNHSKMMRKLKNLKLDLNKDIETK